MKKLDRKQRPIQKAKILASNLKDLDDVTPIIEFIETFKKLADPRAQDPLKLISIKIPVPLLSAFRFKAERQGVRY